MKNLGDILIMIGKILLIIIILFVMIFGYIGIANHFEYNNVCKEQLENNNAYIKIIDVNNNNMNCCVSRVKIVDNAYVNSEYCEVLIK